LTTEDSRSLTAELWKTLGDHFAEMAREVCVDDAAKAMRLAACAEACFWQATGEGDCWNVKDIIGPSANKMQSKTLSYH